MTDWDVIWIVVNSTVFKAILGVGALGALVRTFPQYMAARGDYDAGPNGGRKSDALTAKRCRRLMLLNLSAVILFSVLTIAACVWVFWSVKGRTDAGTTLPASAIAPLIVLLGSIACVLLFTALFFFTRLSLNRLVQSGRVTRRP